jgi:dihydrofolate reductase
MSAALRRLIHAGRRVMRKVVVSEFVTLDGVFENPEWSMPYHSFGHTVQMAMKLDELRAADALLFGRITYEGMAASWPQMTAIGGEYAERMNSYPKYVASTTLTDPTWNASVLAGDLPTAVRELQAQPGRDLLVYGSGTLVADLARHDLIDEYRLMVFPIVLGTGRRFFPDGFSTTLKLAETTPYDSGAVLLTYRRATQGS